MDRLDHLVAEHLEQRLLNPKRLEDLLAAHLDRREERDTRRRETANELTKRAAEAEQRLIPSGYTTPSKAGSPIWPIRP